MNKPNCWKHDLKDFKYFKERCEFYRKRLGMMDMDISYEFVDLRDLNRYAQADTEPSKSIALITLNKYINQKIDLSQTAIHEILHVYLSQTALLAISRYTTEALIEQSHEKDVVKLTNLLLPLL